MAKAKYKGTGFKGDPEKHKRYIYNELIKDGFSHAAATGIVGNILVETGNFKYVEEIEENINKERGLGILQWSGPRANDFTSWLKVNNKKLTDVKANVEYFLLEMKKTSRKHWTSGMSYDKMKTIDNVSDATEMFMSGYLRPSKRYSHYDKRLAYANKYDKVFKGEEYKDSKQLEDFDKEIRNNLLLNRQYTEAGNNADKIMAKVGFNSSTISGEDMQKFRNKARNFVLDGAIMSGDTEDPYAKVVKRAYQNTGELDRKIMEEGFEREEGELIEPSRDENAYLLGGTIQPNGRKSQFLREEDIVAQNKTSYTPS